MSSVPATVPTVRVFIAGGSYAGLSAALNLLDLGHGLSPRMAWEPYTHQTEIPNVNFQITLVDERDGFLHLIGSPLALADAEYAKKAWVKFTDIPALQHPSITLVQGTVTAVDCETKSATVLDNTTKDSTTHHYDYFVTASGLRRVWPVVPQSLSRKQYLVETGDHIHAVHNAKHGVVVVGGGAVGIEMAAELKLVKPDIKVTLAHSRDKLLSSEGLPDDCKDKALELLQELGVETLMGHRLASSNKVSTTDGSTKYDVEFTNGLKIAASEVIMAISRSEPTTRYLPLSALNEEGYVKILPNLGFPLETPNAKFHFCGGDAAQWSGIKRAGGAMHAGHYMACNIHQAVLQQNLPSYEPQFKELVETLPMIGLSVGKKAVAAGPDMETISGEDVMKLYFGDDLGFKICWNHMQLDGRKDGVKL